MDRLTHATDSFFACEAEVVIDVPRGGENDRISLHGTIRVCLEMLILAVASTLPQRTVKTMKRLQNLNRGLKPAGKKQRQPVTLIQPPEAFFLPVTVCT